MTSDPFAWRKSVFDLIKDHGRGVMSGKTTAEVCQIVIDRALEFPEYGASVVNVWSVDPRSERLIRVTGGFRPSIRDSVSTAENVIPGSIDIAKTFTGMAYESRRPWIWQDLKTPQRNRVFGNPAMIDRYQLESMLSIPIPNSCNPHQITHVIDIFFSFRIQADLFDSEGGETEFERRELRQEFQSIVQLLAGGIESNLRERAYRMATATSYALGRIKPLTAETAARVLAERVVTSIETDYATVFLRDWSDNLTLMGWAWDTGLPKSAAWDVRSEKIPTLVSQTYRENREYLSTPVLDKKYIEQDLVGTSPPESEYPIESALLIPLQDDKGDCCGVLRAINLRRPDRGIWRRPHTYDDIAIVEAMGRAFSPLLQGLLESIQRTTSLRTLAHELRFFRLFGGIATSVVLTL